MSECERVERKASVEMTFVGCADHGHFEAESLSIDSSQIDPMEVADTLFSAIEEMIVVHISGHPDVAKLLTEEHKWEWSETAEQLPERAQKQVAKLLAHQLMLSRVASRGYGRVVESAVLSIPRSD